MRREFGYPSPRAAAISIHAPRAGCDPGFRLGALFHRNFNPRTPCGVRPTMRIVSSSTAAFQSTHPVRGATQRREIIVLDGRISIHAPRAGCDRLYSSINLNLTDFNPRTPCGVRRFKEGGAHGMDHFNPRTPCGVRLAVARPCFSLKLFQSTHPVRGATFWATRGGGRLSDFNPRTPCGVRRHFVKYMDGQTDISIHAPRAGCDYHNSITRALSRISIHAPRAGCDHTALSAGVYGCRFQSTHPVRGATSV